jgi:hypothetical protein
MRAQDSLRLHASLVDSAMTEIDKLFRVAYRPRRGGQGAVTSMAVVSRRDSIPTLQGID